MKCRAENKRLSKHGHGLYKLRRNTKEEREKKYIGTMMWKASSDHSATKTLIQGQELMLIKKFTL